jgi:ketosteroid isomerase-like protein
MHPHAELIQRFYTAFARRDAEGVCACYHRDVVFEDPAFGELHGDAARDMWRMLCERGKDLKVEFRDVRGDANGGSAHWEAWYTFATTGKPVHNIIDASFKFKDGLIVDHRDRFDFHRWAGQALGGVGKLLGGFGFFHRAFTKKARGLLSAWQAKR